MESIEKRCVCVSSLCTLEGEADTFIVFICDFVTLLNLVIPFITYLFNLTILIQTSKPCNKIICISIYSILTGIV